MGCDSDSTSRPAIAAASEDEVSCGLTSKLDPTKSVLNWQQIGETIHGDSAEVHHGLSHPFIGRAIEISSDGSKVVATVGHDGIRTYELNDDGLAQSGDDLVNVGTHNLVLSGDGNTLLRDVWFESYGAGSIEVDRWGIGGNWEFHEQFFGDEHEWLGASFAISASGNMIAISQSEDQSNEESYNNGLIRTYALTTEDTWFPLQEIIGENTEKLSGSIDLSNDGLTMLVQRQGGINGYKLVGDQWEYLEDLNGFTDVFNKYVFDAAHGSPASVRNISMSGNGGVVAVTYNEGPGSGRFGEIFTSVRLFKLEDSSVQQIGESIDGYYSRDGFGDLIEVSCDGSIVLIGADSNNESNAYVRAFVNYEDTWHQIGEDITFDQYGLGDIALSADGRTAVISVGNNGAFNHHGELLAYGLVATPIP